MRRFPAPIHNAVAALGRLPGVGPKTALRYAFSLLRLSKPELVNIGRAISELGNISSCRICFTYAEREACDICTDETRDTSKLCIVAEARDIATIEATGVYRGRYFVLGGTLNPIDGRTPEMLNVRQLMERLKIDAAIAECILAFSPDVHGETTILYLSRQLKSFNKKLTRLARGLPMGADIEYADEVTLASAMQGRSAA
ncbi:MAG: recombination mediator RecR [Patescibacteria group bacterium]|mgnify:CR=1 FL=1